MFQNTTVCPAHVRTMETAQTLPLDMTALVLWDMPEKTAKQVGISWQLIMQYLREIFQILMTAPRILARMVEAVWIE